MKNHTLTSVISAILILFLIGGCLPETGPVRLALKFADGQNLTWSIQSKALIREFENDSLVAYTESTERSFATEQVLAILEDSSARIRRTNYYPSPDDNNPLYLTDSNVVSWSAEYTQSTGGQIRDYMPQDTVNAEILAYYQKIYDQVAPNYPDRPVTPGYSWSQSVRVALPDGRVTTAATRYKVRSFARVLGYDCAVIESQGTVLLPFAGTDQNAGSSISGQSQKDISGITYFAYKDGFIVRYEETYDSRLVGRRHKADDDNSFAVYEKGTYSYWLIETSADNSVAIK
ncbi:MAG: hypothetical protein JW763_09160 [candidate division Zixibacteria bacterium]|nr:hypothetical protein [candidate division Zixibacteria bacterium]